MKKSNAERQRAYRDRKRNARNATVPPIGVTRSGRGKDYWKDGVEFIWIGNFGFGDIYAKVIQKPADRRSQSRPNELRRVGLVDNPTFEGFLQYLHHVNGVSVNREAIEVRAFAVLPFDEIDHNARLFRLSARFAV